MAIIENYTVTGSLTDSNGVVQGTFDSNNYVETSGINLGLYDNWSIVIPVQFTSLSSHQQYWRQIRTNDVFTMGIYPERNMMYIDLFDDNGGSIAQPGLQYTYTNVSIIKLEFTGIAYNVYTGNTEDDLTLQTSVNSSTKVKNVLTPIILNNEYGWSYTATYNMTGFKVYGNGELVYIGHEVKSEAGTHIQLRHDTASNWATVNPVLLDGEVGVERELSSAPEAIQTTEFTAATTDGWVATCNAYSSDWSSNWYRVFDTTDSYGWYEGNNFGNPAWIQLKFPQALTLSGITLKQNGVSNSLAGEGSVTVIYSDDTTEQVGTFTMDSTLNKEYSVDFGRSIECVGIRITITSRLAGGNGVSVSTVRMLGAIAPPSFKLKIGDGATAWNSLPYFMSDTVKSSSITNIVQISQADYDALATKDANTLYVIV